MVGASLAVVGLLVGLVQAGLTRIVNPWLGDRKSIYIGLFLYSVGLVLFGVATQSWMMFAFLIPYCLGGIANPALQSAIASQIPSSQQGELQGALTSLMSLTTIIGPLIMNNLFTYFTSSKAPFYFPGIPFILGAAFMIGSLVLVWYIMESRKKNMQLAS